LAAFDREIVSGSILRSIWKLAWPLVLLNLVNGVHGLVDHILVGHFVQVDNNAANAAIGVAWQMFMVVVVFIASLFHGMNVLISRYAGRQDRVAMSKVFHATFVTAVIFLVLVVAPVGYFSAPALLRFVAPAPEVTRQALPYLRILFAGGAPLFLMLLMTGAFQASGDPRTPLKLGVLATVLNIVISFVLIAGVGPIPPLGIVGAALGTVIAPMVSVTIALSLVFRRKMILQPPDRFRMFPDLAVLRVVGRIGLPTGIQGVLLNVGGVFLIRFIGSLEYSAAAQAAYTICYGQLFSLVTWPSFGLRAASATVMGQNIGAGYPDRGKRAVALAAGMGASWAVLVGLGFWLMPGTLMGFFNANQGLVLIYGESLLHYLAFSGVVLAATLALTGGIQGAGATRLPMIIAFFTQIVVLLGFCGVLSWQGALTTDRIWMAILISHLARLVLTYAVFRTEKWTRTVVEFE
jgi:putative MATE family efflux protein